MRARTDRTLSSSENSVSRAQPAGVAKCAPPAFPTASLGTVAPTPMLRSGCQGAAREGSTQARPSQLPASLTASTPQA